MRIRLSLSIVCVVLLFVLIGTPTPQAQSQSIAERESSWERRTGIRLPVDDDESSEGDDELADIPAPVAQTGQVMTHFSGDDGELRKGVTWPCTRYTDNQDGTVTDHLTELVWLQDATRFSGANWNTALSTCNNLADDGLTLSDGSVAGDWRLPNNKELRSLIDFGRSNPALPAGHPFAVPFNGVFWTSTTATNNTGRAWTIEDATMLNDPKNTPNLIWPVRDACESGCGPAPVPKTGQSISYGSRDDGELQAGVDWPDPRLANNLDGTVTDELTGLIWLTDPSALVDLSFEDALAACNALAADGVTLTDGSIAGDWRLPNIGELNSLNDYSQKGPALPVGHPFNVPAADNYWSSTTAEDNINRAWSVGMGIGRSSSLPKNQLHRAWPVRGGYDVDDDECDDEFDDIGLFPFDGLENSGSSNGTVALTPRR